jgi:hypothetical protein
MLWRNGSVALFFSFRAGNMAIVRESPLRWSIGINRTTIFFSLFALGDLAQRFGPLNGLIISLLSQRQSMHR